MLPGRNILSCQLISTRRDIVRITSAHPNKPNTNKTPTPVAARRRNYPTLQCVNIVNHINNLTNNLKPSLNSVVSLQRLGDRAFRIRKLLVEFRIGLFANPRRNFNKKQPFHTYGFKQFSQFGYEVDQIPANCLKIGAKPSM